MEELLVDLERFGDSDAMHAFADRDPPPMSWDAAAREIDRLPSSDAIGVSPFVRSRIVTELGMVLHAFTSEVVNDDVRMFTAVHCFHQEPVEPARQQPFILFSMEGMARIVPAEIYLRALESSGVGGDVYLVHAYDIELETARAPAQA